MTLDLSNCHFAFLDLETTGLSPWFGDRVCEVGIVQTVGKRIKATYQQLVNPERPLSPAAASTNGLSDVDLRDAPIFPEIAPNVDGRLRGAVIVCHNARFDLQFLDSEFRRMGAEIVAPNLIDTLLVAREHFDFPSYTLASVAEQFHVVNPEAHRALADALTMKGVFFAMMDALKQSGRTLEDFIGLYNSPAWPNDGIQLPTALGEAIYAGRRLNLTYIDKGGKRTTRLVTPIQVMGLADYLYLRAYCHLRKSERTFRLDRIVEISLEG